MLAFPIGEVPELARGKGNKLINVPSAAFNSGEETMIAMAVISQADKLLVRAGQRHLRMKLKDLEHYVGATRAARPQAAARISESGRRRRRVFLSAQQFGLMVERGAVRIGHGRDDHAAVVCGGRERAQDRIGLLLPR